MSNLITTGEAASFMAIRSSVFDAMATSGVVFKEPIRRVDGVDSSNAAFGYGDNQSSMNYSFVPVSGVFPMVKKRGYSEKQHQTQTAENAVNIQYGGAQKAILVRGDCKSYIENGATKLVVFEGVNWKIVSQAKSKYFLDSIYYSFELERVD